VLRSRSLVLRIANAIFTHAGITAQTVEEYARLNGLRESSKVDINRFVPFINDMLQQESTFDPSAARALSNSGDPRALLFDTHHTGILWNRVNSMENITHAVDPFNAHGARAHLADTAPGAKCRVNLNVLGHNKVRRVEMFKYGTPPAENASVRHDDGPGPIELEAQADYAVLTDTAPVGIAAYDHSSRNAFDADGVGPFDTIEFETYACERDGVCPFFNGLAVVARCIGAAQTHAEAVRAGDQAEAIASSESKMSASDAVQDAMVHGSEPQVRDIARKLFVQQGT
jgi:hypothetical protein